MISVNKPELTNKTKKGSSPIDFLLGSFFVSLFVSTISLQASNVVVVRNDHFKKKSLLIIKHIGIAIKRKHFSEGT